MKKPIKKISYLVLFCLLVMPTLICSQELSKKGPYEKSEPFKYNGRNDLVFEGLEISATDTWCIACFRCENIIIRNCKFTSAPNKSAVYLEHCTNLIIEDCFFDSVYEGVWAQGCKGTIKMEYNDIKNIRGNLDGGPRFAHGFQLSNCAGDISVCYNSIDNIPGESSPEDNINLYASHGTPERPIIVRGNWIRGGGPNLSGGGINLGDYGGSYQIAEDNIVVNSGSGGMGMAGGHDLTIRNNKIYGKRTPVSNWGIIIANWTPLETGPSYNITVENNKVNWTGRDGSLRTAWFDDFMKSVVPNYQIVYQRDPSISESILPDDIFIRTKKVTDIVVTPRGGRTTLEGLNDKIYFDIEVLPANSYIKDWDFEFIDNSANIHFTKYDGATSTTQESVNGTSVIRFKAIGASGVYEDFTIEVTGATGIDESANKMHFSMYPNPVKQTLTIEMKQMATGCYEISTLQGKKVMEGVVEHFKFPLDVSLLRTGIYLIKVTSKNETHTEPFIKE